LCRAENREPIMCFIPHSESASPLEFELRQSHELTLKPLRGRH